MTSALLRHWWMLALRGVLAGSFGLVVLSWPDLTLGQFVVLFAAYALADGLCAVFSAFGLCERWIDAGPVLAEGAVSLVVGAAALTWPLVPLLLVYLVATWGIIMGALELAAAVALRGDRGGSWLLAIGGVSSLMLGMFLVLIPGAATAGVARVVGAYALIFGALLAAASLRLWRLRPHRPARGLGVA